MNALSFNLHEVAVLAPGLTSFAELQEVFRDNLVINNAEPLILAVPELLPPNERRRSSQSVRLVLSCISQLAKTSQFQLNEIRSVFATDDGVGEVSQQMLEVLSTTRQISPLVFPNSVHSATAGYFSIAYRNQKPSTVVSRGLESFAAGLLCAVIETLTVNEPVLFVCSDPVMTHPMDELLPITQPTALAWLLSAGDSTAPVLASFALTIESDEQLCTPLPLWIPKEWRSNSASYGYAALELLASQSQDFYRLGYGAQTLKLELIKREPL